MGLVVFFCIFLTSAFIHPEGAVHEMLDMAGLLLISICALGRLYTTAFLGGSKNETLISWGPFSVVRNPLYVFSWIGFTGIALMTTHLVLIICVPVFFYILYYSLVQREEAFLIQKFGHDYADYKSRVPRFFPNLSLYKSPDEIKVSSGLLMNGALDAVWWFAAYPLIELAEFVQEQGMLSPLFMVP